MPEISRKRLLPFEIVKGAPFSRVLRYGAGDFVYKEIEAIDKSAPCEISVPGHGMVDGWFAWISGVRGMTQINREHPASPYRIRVVDADTVRLANINALDFGEYIGNGAVYYVPPVDLAGLSGRMQIRAEASLSSPVLLTPTVTLDNAAKTISVFASAAETAAIDWTVAVHDIELYGVGEPIKLAPTSPVTVRPEVTL